MHLEFFLRLVWRRQHLFSCVSVLPLSHRSLATDRLESIVKQPLCTFLHRLVKHIRQSGYDGEAELSYLQRSSQRRGTTGRLTPIGPQVLSVVFFTFFIALPEYRTMLCIVKAGRPILAML
jgi:hypothetical protein